MASRLNSSPQIYKLAQDLGLRGTGDPVSQIVRFCDGRVKGFLRDSSGCERLTDLLDWVANKVRTRFEVVRTDRDLEGVQRKYLGRGEKSFAQLRTDLSDDVYGITFRLTQRESWEPLFVSVIDCRGQKVWREYYTKWHEIAHLLVQTDQMRLSFRRSHGAAVKRDAEEALMEIIAGNFGFYPPIVRPYAKGEISFEAIEELLTQLCPEASIQASLIGFVRAWPKPCLLVHAELGLRRNEEVQLAQKTLDFIEVPVPALRAVHVTANEAARELRMTIFQNMRVPERSVIYQVFSNERDYDEAEEEMSWWQASNGTRLPRQRVLVKAKRIQGSVQALVLPAI